MMMCSPIRPLAHKSTRDDHPDIAKIHGNLEASKTKVLMEFSSHFVVLVSHDSLVWLRDLSGCGF